MEFVNNQRSHAVNQMMVYKEHNQSQFSLKVSTSHKTKNSGRQGVSQKDRRIFWRRLANQKRRESWADTHDFVKGWSENSSKLLQIHKSHASIAP